MATVYILYSCKLDRFYTGSCLNLEIRLEEHMNKEFIDGFTSKANDWELFFSMDNLSYNQARQIELHIKRMKSKKYIYDLKKYKEIVNKLIDKYK